MSELLLPGARPARCRRCLSAGSCSQEMCLVRVARGSKVVQGVVEVGELRCLVPREGQEASVETARVEVAVGSNLCLQRARRGKKGCCGGAPDRTCTRHDHVALRPPGCMAWHAAARDVAPRVYRLTMRSTSCSRTEALAGDKKLATARRRSTSENSPWRASA